MHGNRIRSPSEVGWIQNILDRPEVEQGLFVRTGLGGAQDSFRTRKKPTLSDGTPSRLYNLIWTAAVHCGRKGSIGWEKKNLDAEHTTVVMVDLDDLGLETLGPHCRYGFTAQ